MDAKKIRSNWKKGMQTFKRKFPIHCPMHMYGGYINTFVDHVKRVFPDVAFGSAFMMSTKLHYECEPLE